MIVVLIEINVRDLQFETDPALLLPRVGTGRGNLERLAYVSLRGWSIPEFYRPGQPVSRDELAKVAFVFPLNFRHCQKAIDQVAPSTI